MRCLVIALVLGISAGSVTAQPELEPQGGTLLLGVSSSTLGGSLDASITGFPFAQFLILVGFSPGTITFPGFGSIFINPATGLSIPIDSFVTGAPVIPLSGFLPFSLPLPADPMLDGGIAFVQVIAYDGTSPTLFSLSNAKSIQFAFGDSYFPTLGNLGVARAFHQSVRLDSGAVVVAGGGDGALLLPVASTAVELYNPYRRTFTSAAPMSVERTLHRATLLNDGRVLVTGGCQTFGMGHSTAEIFDPATGSWNVVPMNATRIAHTATKLADGRVLITGGAATFVLTPPTSTNYAPIFSSSLDSAEIFDPSTDTFTPIPMPMGNKRLAHAATLLPSGRVLLSGGVRASQVVFGISSPLYATACDIFDPTTNAFTAAAAMMVPRAVHTQDLLTDGTVLALGGVGSSLVVSLNTTEIYDEGLDTWISGPSIPGGQTIALHASTALPDGSIYIGGGAVGALGAFQGIDVAYRYDVATGFTTLAPIDVPRQAHTVTWTPEGVLLIAGADAGNPTAMPVIDAVARDTASIWTPN